MKVIAQRDPQFVVWWGTYTECQSALARRTREGGLSQDDRHQALALLEQLADVWTEILPTGKVRTQAGLVLGRHPLRAADALQLAAALVWVSLTPSGEPFNTLDERVATAAEREGFTLMNAT